MATSAQRAAGRKSTSRTAPVRARAAAPAAEETEKPTIDTTLDAWSAQATRDQLAWEISACTAWLRGAKALREAQMQSAEQTEAAYLKAAEQLMSARGIDEFANIQFELLRQDAEQAMQYWQRMSEVLTRSLAEVYQEATAGWTRASESAMNGFNQWGKFQASLPQTADMVEAEVEHVANPLAASPMMWPMQEASRQAFDVASRTWNEWLQWGNRLPAAASRQ